MSERIEMRDGKLSVPDEVVIPYIEGDGVGKEIMDVALPVFNSAIERVYEGERKIEWKKIYGGKEAFDKFGSYLPEQTIEEIKNYTVAIKGPLTTPVGGGIRSLNVQLRQTLDLYACVRPVKWYEGTPSPVRNPEKLNVVIFRENTEDLYAGIEWKYGTDGVKKVIGFLKEMGVNVREDSGIGVKPISKFASQRIVRAAINYAIKNRRRNITLVHKGNIMKFTEGAFRAWGYEVGREFSQIITEKELFEKYNRDQPADKIVLKDRITDAMFQQVLLYPAEYDVIATPNLNGDYLSDSCAAQVGGLGIAPGGNINYETGAAIFEATHGTAPDIAGKGIVNPSSLLLSGALMFEYLGWKEAERTIESSIKKTIKQKTLTPDLARQIEGATKISTPEFGDEVIKNMQ
jgi:isocitrate dehydrogenase